jgi:hypothetical protein
VSYGKPSVSKATAWKEKIDDLKKAQRKRKESKRKI